MNALEKVKAIMAEEAAKERAENQAHRNGGDGDQEFARLICREHGEVFISEAAYEEQLSRPDSFWECPVMCAEPPMGPCGAACRFDDEHFEAKHLAADDQEDDS